MQKKLYEYKSMQFSPHEHNVKNVLWLNLHKERNPGLYGTDWGDFIYFSEMSVFITKKIIDMSTIKTFITRMFNFERGMGCKKDTH